MKLLAILAALSVVASTSATKSDTVSYTGNWQVKLTHNVFVTSKGYTGHGPDSTHCIALTDNGTVGWPHSGSAVLDNNTNTSGQFSVIGGIILIFIDVPGSGDEPASLVLSTTARNGNVGENGAYDEIQGGESYNAAKATFGQNGSC